MRSSASMTDIDKRFYTASMTDMDKRGSTASMTDLDSRYSTASMTDIGKIRSADARVDATPDAPSVTEVEKKMNADAAVDSTSHSCTKDEASQGLVGDLPKKRKYPHEQHSEKKFKTEPCSGNSNPKNIYDGFGKGNNQGPSVPKIPIDIAKIFADISNVHDLGAKVEILRRSVNVPPLGVDVESEILRRSVNVPPLGMDVEAEILRRSVNVPPLGVDVEVETLRRSVNVPPLGVDVEAEILRRSVNVPPLCVDAKVETLRRSVNVPPLGLRHINADAGTQKTDNETPNVKEPSTERSSSSNKFPDEDSDPSMNPTVALPRFSIGTEKGGYSQHRYSYDPDRAAPNVKGRHSLSRRRSFDSPVPPNRPNFRSTSMPRNPGSACPSQSQPVEDFTSPTHVKPTTDVLHSRQSASKQTSNMSASTESTSRRSSDVSSSSQNSLDNLSLVKALPSSRHEEPKNLNVNDMKTVLNESPSKLLDWLHGGDKDMKKRITVSEDRIMDLLKAVREIAASSDGGLSEDWVPVEKLMDAERRSSLAEERLKNLEELWTSTAETDGDDFMKSLLSKSKTLEKHISVIKKFTDSKELELKKQLTASHREVKSARSPNNSARGQGAAIEKVKKEIQDHGNHRKRLSHVFTTCNDLMKFIKTEHSKRSNAENKNQQLETHVQQLETQVKKLSVTVVKVEKAVQHIPSKETVSTHTEGLAPQPDLDVRSPDVILENLSETIAETGGTARDLKYQQEDVVKKQDENIISSENSKEDELQDLRTLIEEGKQRGLTDVNLYTEKKVVGKGETCWEYRHVHFDFAKGESGALKSREPAVFRPKLKDFDGPTIDVTNRERNIDEKQHQEPSETASSVSEEKHEHGCQTIEKNMLFIQELETKSSVSDSSDENSLQALNVNDKRVIDEKLTDTLSLKNIPDKGLYKRWTSFEKPKCLLGVVEEPTSTGQQQMQGLCKYMEQRMADVEASYTACLLCNQVKWRHVVLFIQIVLFLIMLFCVGIPALTPPPT